MTRPVADVNDPETVGAWQPETSGALGATQPRSHHPPRWVVLGLVAVLVATAAGSGWWLRRGSDDLRVLRPTMGYVLHPLSPGQTSFFLGGLKLRHPGKDVEILDIQVLTSPNAEYLGAFTIWPRDYPTNKLVVGPGFPPSKLTDRHPAIGVRIPASETVFMPTARWSQPAPPPLTVAVGFRVTSGDVGAVNGVRVVYKVGGKTTHEGFHHAEIACVEPNTCKGPKNADEDYADVVLRRFGLVPKE